MKTAWRYLGVVTFWLSWPLWWTYLSGTERTRVLILAEDSILLVRGWIGGGDWQLPGGGLHKGEKVIEGALRELSEETGIVLSKKQLNNLYQAKTTEYGITYNCHCFVAHLPKQLPLKSQSQEITDIAWIRRKDINKLRISKQLASALTQV